MSQTVKFVCGVAALVLVALVAAYWPLLGIWLACEFPAPQMTDFAERRADFLAVVEAVENSGWPEGAMPESGYHCLLLREDGIETMDGTPLAGTAALQEPLCRVGERFDHLWVGEDYVIFWNDETHTYGLLYAAAPRRVIRQIKRDWYETMNSARLDDHWYEIGQLGTL